MGWKNPPTSTLSSEERNCIRSLSSDKSPGCQGPGAAARSACQNRPHRPSRASGSPWDFSPASASSITGVLSNRSIAYGIARACRREGAELAFSYQGERFKERIAEFAAEFGSTLVFDCDVADDAQIERAVRGSSARPGRRFDGFVHSIGFAPREAIAGDFLDGLSREAFRIAHDISSYSFPAMAKAALPRLRPASALLTLTYLGARAQRAQLQHHGPGQGVARGQRALPGRQPGRRRACASTASRPGRSRRWPRRASRASARSSTSSPSNAPLRRNVTIDDVGNVAAFLLSDLAAGMTSEIVYVDGGFSQAAMACAEPPEGRRPSSRGACHAVDVVATSSRSTADALQLGHRHRPWMSVSKPGNAVLKSRANCRYSTILRLKRSPGISSGMPGG